jgi:hypothetical protein
MDMCARKLCVLGGNGRVSCGRRERAVEDRHNPEEEAGDWLSGEPEDDRANRRREREPQVDARVRRDPQPAVSHRPAFQRCTGRKRDPHEQDTEHDGRNQRGRLEAERKGRRDQGRRQERLEGGVDVDGDESQKRHIHNQLYPSNMRS